MTLRGASSRAAAALAAIVGVVVLMPSPASAHAQTGISPTNYKSEVRSLTPPEPGLRLRLLELGRLVELRNRTGTEVVVLGYQGEPYLRVGPAGVFENRQSPTFEQNKVSATTTSTPAGTAPPASTSPDDLPGPEWHKVSGSQTVRWRDQRTRWEGPTPAVVRANPGQPHSVASWTIELRRGSASVVVAGTITWIPPPRATVWLLMVALGLAAGVLAAAASRRWGPLLAAVLALLVAIDIVLSIGGAAFDSRPISSQLVTILLSGLLSVGAWIAAAVAINWLQQYREEGMWLGGFAGTVILLYGGLGGAFSLGRSQLPYAVPAGLARCGIAASLGLGLGMALAAPVVWRRHLYPVVHARAGARPGRRR